ncbi:unnamed protein product [Withania somnifera]
MKNCQRKCFDAEEIRINILNRLPLESLAKFKCLSKTWRKYIAESYHCRLQWPEPYLLSFFCIEKRLQSHFFFSSKESSLLIGAMYIVASSNGFLLCNKLKSRQRVYYVYNPATRQRLDLPKTRYLMDDPYVGFTCKVYEDDSASFTKVRYAVPVSWENFKVQYHLTIESFSSETNVWTTTNLIVDVPIDLYPSRDMTSSTSSGVVDGIFCWLNYGCMTVYDSVEKRFWVLELPQRMRMVYPGSCFLGVSGGESYFATNYWTKTITCWQLNNYHSPDNAVWIWNYAVDVATIIQNCPVRNNAFHPALPNMLYLQIRSKIISYDLKTSAAELVYDFGEAWRKTQHYKLFSYEWHQWPRLQ